MNIKFNPRLPPMSSIIKKHIDILSLTEETAKLFHKDSLFVSYKMEKNILSLITKNKFKTPPVVDPPRPMGVGEDQKLGCFKCKNNCTLCKIFLVESTEFSSPRTKQKFQIKSYIDCQTKNII